jgi:hypothetical protein
LGLLSERRVTRLVAEDRGFNKPQDLFLAARQRRASKNMPPVFI